MLSAAPTAWISQIPWQSLIFPRLKVASTSVQNNALIRCSIVAWLTYKQTNQLYHQYHIFYTYIGKYGLWILLGNNAKYLYLFNVIRIRIALNPYWDQVVSLFGHTERDARIGGNTRNRAHSFAPVIRYPLISHFAAWITSNRMDTDPRSSLFGSSNKLAR